MKVFVFQSFGNCPRCIRGQVQMIVVVVESDVEIARRRLDDLSKEREDGNRIQSLPQLPTFRNAEVVASWEVGQPGVVFAPRFLGVPHNWRTRL